MTKLYNIEYSHIGGSRSLQTTDINQLLSWLEEALNDRHVSDESIVLTTEIRKEQ